MSGKIISIRLPTDLYEILEKYSKQLGMSKSVFIRKNLQESLVKKSATSLPDVILIKISFISLVLQQNPSDEAWEVVRREVHDLCQMIEESHSV